MLLQWTLVLAVSQTILAENRVEDHLSCATAKLCIHSYVTGSALCDSGYTRQNYEVSGYPGGSYCYNKCTPEERTTCNADTCNFFEGQCHRSPGNVGLCKDALKWCDGPVATVKTICTKKDMRRPVTYDDAKRVCLPAGKTADSRKYIELRLGIGTRYLVTVKDDKVGSSSLDFVCEPTTYSSAKSMANKLLADNKGCKLGIDEDQANSGHDFVRVDCKTPKDTWRHVEELTTSDCATAEAWQGKQPHFQTNVFGDNIPY